MRTVAVIPVRSGSVRCPNKNIRPFAGSSLLEICIKKLKKLNLDEIIVDSDSMEMLDLAKRLGVTARRRPSVLALSTTKPPELASHIAKETNADVILIAHCTSPLVSVETMKKFIETDWTGHDSLNSGNLLKRHMILHGRPLNYKPPRPNTQELPEIYGLNYGLNMIRRRDMMIYKDFVGDKPKVFETPENESMDIDTTNDFLLAEKIYEATRKTQKNIAK